MDNTKSFCAFCAHCDVLRGQCLVDKTEVNIWDDSCGDYEESTRKGFTLVEMLVVVAIIGVLLAIAIPSFTRNLEMSRETADVGNLRAAYGDAFAKHYLEESTGDTETISGVKLSSSGALQYVDVNSLPFTLPASFSVSSGSYSATFDFSADTPSVALTAESSD